MEKIYGSKFFLYLVPLDVVLSFINLDFFSCDLTLGFAQFFKKVVIFFF
jgi:hypothetical protein